MIENKMVKYYTISGYRIFTETHFTSKEMHCRCGCGLQVEPDLIIRLEMLRLLVDRPLCISSGARCPAHNKAEGGRPKSKHLLGIAADIKIEDEAHGNSIVFHAQNLGFYGIGVANTFIHVDSRAKPKRWTY